MKCPMGEICLNEAENEGAGGDDLRSMKIEIMKDNLKIKETQLENLKKKISDLEAGIS